MFWNGTQLTYNINWVDNTTTADKTPDNGDPMAFKIKVLDALPGDIYTVTYTPLTSSTRAIPQNISTYTGTGLDVVDLTGDLTVRLLPSQIIAVDRGINEADVASSKVFFIIIIRNNSSRNTLTAAVEEFMLVLGSKDASKFED